MYKVCLPRLLFDLSQGEMSSPGAPPVTRVGGGGGGGGGERPSDHHRLTDFPTPVPELLAVMTTSTKTLLSYFTSLQVVQP